MDHQIASDIEKCIQQDPGGRGIAQWACKAELLPAALSLLRSEHVVITTGFYILAAGAIETDGPPGAIILANSLQKLGKDITLLVDDHAASIMNCGLKSLSADIDMRIVAPGRPIPPLSVIKDTTTHFVALERPGRTKDGRYYNFAGKDITAYVAPVDDLFLHARGNSIVTIGIGDGGNELGMQRVSVQVDQHLNFMRPISCRIPADYCVCAGVSNWGGYGLAAIMSVLSGKKLLPPVEKLIALIQAIVQAGAVDGISAAQETTVDGLASFWEHDVYMNVSRLAAAA